MEKFVKTAIIYLDEEYLKEEGAIKVANKPMFVFFKEAKHKDDDFFLKVKNDKEKYFKNLKFVKDYLEGKKYDNATIANLIKYLSVIYVAQERGYLDVDWDRVFAIKRKDSFQQIVTLHYEQVEKEYPEISQEWEKKLKEHQKKKKAKKESNVMKK